jgi:hypothetical protein
MTDSLVVVLDGVSQLEYRHGTVLAEQQIAYLDQLDQRMDGGIELGGLRIESPDILQRAQYVSLQMLQAVESGNESVAAATCTYLANRLPDLKQVRAITRGGQLTFDLVFDRAYAKEIKVEFMKPVEN